MDQTISIESILRILRKHLRMIIVSTIVGMLAAAVVTFVFMTPKYQASVDILVNRKQENDINNQLSDQQADVQMINTYKDIITKSVTLTPVRKEIQKQLGYDISVAELQGMISVTNQTNSQVFSVSVTDTDPARSATIANIIAKSFQEKVKQVLSVNNVTIIAEATKPHSAVSPRRNLNLAIGLVLGVLVGIGLAFLRELTDHNVKDMDYLTDELGLTKLGIVSHYHSGGKKSGGKNNRKQHHPRSQFSAGTSTFDNKTTEKQSLTETRLQSENRPSSSHVHSTESETSTKSFTTGSTSFEPRRTNIEQPPLRPAEGLHRTPTKRV